MDGDSGDDAGVKAEKTKKKDAPKKKSAEKKSTKSKKPAEVSDDDKEESDMGIGDASLEKKGKEEDPESPPDDKQNLVTSSEEQVVEGEAEGKKSHLKMS